MSLFRSPRLLLLLLATSLLGCDTTTAPPPTSQLVVEAYLHPQAPLPTVRLTRTTDVTEPYDPREDAVRSATVTIEHLTGDGSVAESISYSETDSIPGVYAPIDPPIVQPQTTYRLRATAGDSTVTATTTVPKDFDLVSTAHDTTVYRSANQPTLTINPPPPPSGERTVYAISSTSRLPLQRLPLDSLRSSLTPRYRDDFDADEDNIASFRTFWTGLLSEGDFIRNADGTLTAEIQWPLFAFFGRNEIAIRVLDENYRDFLRSVSAQEGGAGVGALPNVIEHVEGGTGVFGSYTQVAHPVCIVPPDRVSCSSAN